jgi:hypothetical protein
MGACSPGKILATEAEKHAFDTFPGKNFLRFSHVNLTLFKYSINVFAGVFFCLLIFLLTCVTHKHVINMEK